MSEVFNKEELIWSLEIMYSIKAGTSEFTKCTIPFLEKLYYNNIQNSMRTNELAVVEAKQRTKILELEQEVSLLKAKLATSQRNLRKAVGGKK